MKRIEAMALAIVGIAVMIFGLFFLLNPLRVPHTNTINLDPLGEGFLYRDRQRGERVEGSLTVTGGDEEVWFTIEDPNGVTVDYVGVNRRIDFAFTAEYDGMYLYRVNNAQQDSGKTVFLTEQLVVDRLTREFWLVIVGAGAFSLGLGLIGYFSEKRLQDRKTKTQVIPHPPPPPP
jgi:hypothetical protein